MKVAKKVLNQINQLTTDLVKMALCDDQNFPVLNGSLQNRCCVEYSNIVVSGALKNRPYHEFYREIDSTRNFNLKLLDGALVQLHYAFENNSLVSHRLGYFPNPNTVDFQNDPEMYLEDDIYLDVVDQRIVVTPMRFDYDIRDDVMKNIEHPMSHLTIGQYENCRIPVVRPLTPSQFICFIIRNFYNTALKKTYIELQSSNFSFESTITSDEKKIIHIGIY